MMWSWRYERGRLEGGGPRVTRYIASSELELSVHDFWSGMRRKKERSCVVATRLLIGRVNWEVENETMVLTADRAPSAPMSFHVRHKLALESMNGTQNTEGWPHTMNLFVSA
jgi:hypothetical protein